MIKPTASDIVSAIGNALFEHDYTALGINKERDQRALEDSLKFFIASWLNGKLAELCVKKSEKVQTRFTFSEYAFALEKFLKDKGLLFRSCEISYRRIVLETRTNPFVLVELTRIHERDGSITIQIEPNRREYYGGEYCMSPKMLVDTIENLDEAIHERKMAIMESNLKLCLPPGLQPLFKRAKLTKGMGHSIWAGDDYLYGHETRLGFSKKHDFTLAYTTDNFQNPRLFENVFNNAVKAYQLLHPISEMLPSNVCFECVHADDFGVDFTNEGDFPKHYWDICHAMDRISEYLEDEVQLTIEDFEYILKDLQLDNNLTAQGLKDNYYSGISLRRNKAKEVERMLHSQQGRFVISVGWHCLHLFTIPERKYERECFLAIPYDTELGFLSQFGTFLDVTKEILQQYKDDDCSSVALMTVND